MGTWRKPFSSSANGRIGAPPTRWANTNSKGAPSSHIFFMVKVLDSPSFASLVILSRARSFAEKAGEAALTPGALCLTIPRPLVRGAEHARVQVSESYDVGYPKGSNLGMAWHKWFVRGLVFSVFAGAVLATLAYQHWTNPAAVRLQVLAKTLTMFPGALATLD